MSEENIEQALFEGTGISEEDKRDVLEQIDKVVEENRIPVTKDLFLIKPRRKGALFPIMINILALLLVAGGLYAAFLYFGRKQESLTTETERYLSMEGKLIEELKKESEAKLKEKESEISKIQTELAELDRQSQDLRNNMEETIKSKEDQLRIALEVELEEERQKLRSQGVSTAQIEERIKALEEAKRQELNQTVAVFRQESEVVLRGKEQELKQAKDLAEEILARANQDKAALQVETQRRESELRARYEQETSTLRNQSEEAQKRLKELSDMRAQEQLFLDQVTGSYASIQQKLAADDFPSARADLARLQTILSDRAFDTLPNLSKRKPVELFIAQILSENLDTRTSSASTETVSIVEAANKLLAARELAERAEEAFRQGRIDEAKRQYTKALQDVPAMFASFEGLLRIRNAELTAEAERFLQQADVSQNAGKRGAELFEDYRRAILAAAGPSSTQAASALAKLEASMALQFTEERMEAVRVATGDTTRAKDEVIADRENKLKAETEARMRVERLLAAAETKAADAEKALTESGNNEESLRKELAALRTERLSLQNNVADLEKRIASLNSGLSSLQGDTGNQQALIAQLRNQLEEKNREVDGLNRRLAAAETAAATALAAAATAPAAAPAASAAPATGVSQERLNAEKTAAEKKGREQALTDVIIFADAMAKGAEGATPGEIQKIESLAARDFLYKTAFERIEALVAGSAGSPGSPGIIPAIAAEEPKLIGTVASVSPGRIIVETLVNMQIANGAKLIVKRKSRTAGEITIASGVVSNTAAGRITAQIETLANQAQQPMIMDLVYLEI